MVWVWQNHWKTIEHDGAPWNAHLGKGPATKSDDFLEKFQTVFDPPATSFLENYIAIFYNGHSCIYAKRYEGQII